MVASMGPCPAAARIAPEWSCMLASLRGGQVGRHRRRSRATGFWFASAGAALVSLAGLQQQLNFGVVSPPLGEAAAKQKVLEDDEEGPMGAAAVAPASGLSDVVPEPEDQVDAVGVVNDFPASPRGAAKYKPLHPYVIVDTRPEAAGELMKIRQGLRNPAVHSLDLIGVKAAAGKMLMIMGNVGGGLQFVGQVESVRSSEQVKIRLSKYFFLPNLDEAETHQGRVSANTDPKRLAVHMRMMLFDRFTVKENQCFKLLGKGNEVWRIMYEAIDYLQRDVERAMSFTVSATPECTEVTVYAAEQPRREQDTDSSGDGFKLRDLLPTAVQYSPLIEIRDDTDRISCSTRVMRSLTVHTTPSVDLEVCVYDARGMALFTLASLPDWLGAAAMVVPNPWRQHLRYRVVKGFVVDGLDENPPLQARVGPETEPGMLAKYIRGVMNGKAQEDATPLDEVSGPRATDRIEALFDSFETANIVCSALSHVFWETNREIYFTVKTQKVDGRRNFIATIFWAN